MSFFNRIANFLLDTPSIMGNAQSNTSDSASVATTSTTTSTAVYKPRPIDDEVTINMIKSMKAAVDAIENLKKYHLANTWIANIIKKGPEVPDKSNPYFVDEDASVFLRYVLKYVKLTIKAEKYILAAEIIKYEITKIPDRDPILVGLGKARDAVGLGNYPLAANTIVKLVDTAKPNAFLYAAAHHETRCKKPENRILLLSLTESMYKKALALRPDNKTLLGITNASSDAVKMAQQASKLKTGYNGSGF